MQARENKQNIFSKLLSQVQITLCRKLLSFIATREQLHYGKLNLHCNSSPIKWKLLRQKEASEQCQFLFDIVTALHCLIADFVFLFDCPLIREQAPIASAEFTEIRQAARLRQFPALGMGDIKGNYHWLLFENAPFDLLPALRSRLSLARQCSVTFPDKFANSCSDI